MNRVFLHLVPALMIAALGLVVGCSGNGDGPGTVKVTGKITHGGGAWDRPATLSFVPVLEGGNDKPYSAAANVKSDGTFDVDLVPGKYQVAVHCWDADPAENPNAKSLVPKQFESGASSGLTLDVAAGKAAKDITWDVPKA